MGAYSSFRNPNVSHQHVWNHPHKGRRALAGRLGDRERSFLPGWKAVKNFDGYEVGRKIEEAKWHFF
jgi:hypothetical protein